MCVCGTDVCVHVELMYVCMCACGTDVCVHVGLMYVCMWN